MKTRTPCEGDSGRLRGSHCCAMNASSASDAWRRGTVRSSGKPGAAAARHQRDSGHARATTTQQIVLVWEREPATLNGACSPSLPMAFYAAPEKPRKTRPPTLARCPGDTRPFALIVSAGCGHLLGVGHCLSHEHTSAYQGVNKGLLGEENCEEPGGAHARP